jgi:hypothetical protein
MYCLLYLTNEIHSFYNLVSLYIFSFLFIASANIFLKIFFICVSIYFVIFFLLNPLLSPFDTKRIEVDIYISA